VFDSVFTMIPAAGVWDAITGFFANCIEWLFGLTKAIGMPSYILAIFLFTLIVKLLLQPLMNKSMRASRKMQMLAPDVEDIKRRYASNPQRVQQETMKLYKEHGASPTAGCLPMLLQMPILIALFDALRSFQPAAENLPYFNFFIWNDLSAIVSDATTGLSTWILPIAAAGATFLQQKLTTPNAKDNSQKIMLIAFPLMFLFFVRSFPVLLGFYWIFYSLIGVAIMYPLLRRWKKIDTAEIEAVRKAKEEETARRKAARKAAQENYYKGKPRKDQDQHGNRGHASEALPEVAEDENEPDEEKSFKTWLKENGYTYTRKKMKVHPYSTHPEVVLIIMDEEGNELDTARMRQEYEAAMHQLATQPVSVKDVFAARKKAKQEAKEKANKGGR